MHVVELKTIEDGQTREGKGQAGVHAVQSVV